MTSFRKVLVANRGEIAIRVMRTLQEMGIAHVAIYADEDKLSLHRFKSDEAFLVGRGLGPVAAYLSIPEVIRVAQQAEVDAIHPGYGLLSENPELAEACEKAGIVFIGPTPETLRSLGDKAQARDLAKAAGLPVLPASPTLPEDLSNVEEMASAVGYPVMLKAIWGGGGRGMRIIPGPEDLRPMIEEGRREAVAAFGRSEGILEKLVPRARHVEVQILGDGKGNVIHLYERDCSIQRRNQKIIERAPAPYLSDAQRQEICGLATRLGESVNYLGAGTVEFLMDADHGNFYFIEVNPRIQVEHTVTEEITGIDIVRAQVRIAQGMDLDQATGHQGQNHIPLSGHAIQCRITTEDPQQNFVPDYGRISAYRVATGMGIRLDGGTAYSGAFVTRFYDSLLEKVTAWAQTPGEAVSRMDRALQEFRIRGVATNIAFVHNLLGHPSFLDYSYTTRFVDETSELYEFDPLQDTATKILNYIADISVNGHPDTQGRARPNVNMVNHLPEVPVILASDMEKNNHLEESPKELLDRKGSKAVRDWMLHQDRLLITETSMRDGHQSLLATRMRSYDMVKIAEAYQTLLPNLFSIECWGGATFDVAYRFLQESPWQRLHDLRERMPKLLLQMLLRASNGVGYTNFPDNVIRTFVQQAAHSGIDIFRVFDSLNWVENMRVAMDAVCETGKICEGTMCYTGNILDPNRAKYDLKYYVKTAKELEAAGAHVLGIKDMAGLLKPASATKLISTLIDEISLPIHFHTHDTAGIGSATVLAAAEAGAHVIDGVIDAFSGGNSQPCLGSIIEALQYTPNDTQLDPEVIRRISTYWEGVRRQYVGFETNDLAPTSEVYVHEIPGGQYSNLREQTRSLGLGDRWHDVTRAYVDANFIFGDIIKVTPSSKAVGDMALLMVSQGLTREDVEDPQREVIFPDSVVNAMRGNIGQPPGGWPDAFVKKVLGGKERITDRPANHLAPYDLDAMRKELAAEIGEEMVTETDFCGYLMYPKVFTDYCQRRSQYGPVHILPTPVFFYGMGEGQQISAEMGPGKVLEIRLLAISESHDDGLVRVFFELNGQPRVTKVINRVIGKDLAARPKADISNPSHVAAPMPGVVATLAAIQHQRVQQGDLLLTIEAMKMETSVNSPRDGIIEEVFVRVGDSIDAKDLLIVIGDGVDNVDGNSGKF